MILFSCRRAAELTSEELDARLPMSQRLALAIHRLACSACRRYRAQVGEIDRAVAEYVDAPVGGDEPLSDESKARIKQALRVVADGSNTPEA